LPHLAPAGPTGPPSEEPTFAQKILALLDQIRAMDKTMDEGRAAKIANIKKAIAAGTYHVSAAEVARRIIDQIDEP
jgi:anti-sigma28 factor (negative regulator of flagellin synthesis)